MKRKMLAKLLFLLLLPSGLVCGEIEGPHLTTEPPLEVEFSSEAGGRLECSAHSTPSSHIAWLLFDGSPMERIPGLREPHPNGSLVFPPFPGELYRQDVHDAVYKCRATNILGSIVSRDVRVRAVVKQKYEVQIYDEHVIAGNTALLRCQVPSFTAEYVIVTSWVQNDNINIYPNTDTGGKYMVMPNGDLFVFNVGPIDGFSTFGCRTVHRLTGDIQSSSYPGRIIVTEPQGRVLPRIKVEKRTRKTVKLGGRVILACSAQGYPLPFYTWFKEESEKLTPVVRNERIIVESNGILYINKVRAEDEGKYICKINNTAGHDEIQVILSVTAPLSVHIHPQRQVVDMWKEASLYCTVTGFPVTKVSWFKNGRPISADKRYNVTKDPDRLIISPILKDDEGMYQCFVYNEVDMAQASAELHLGDASPELSYTFSEQTLQPGPPVSLKCVASGNPPPQFTWTLDGFPIPDSTRFLVGQYVTVHDDVVSHVNISTVKEEDGGEYACIAKNSVAKIFHSARINVYGAPFIRVMPKITAVAGNDLVIKCPVAGYPIESITWERDGSVLPINRRQRVYNNGTLVIEQAQRGTDVGTYTCQAQNRQKLTARRDVEVQVLLPPKILPIHAMTNLLTEGMRAAISCQVLEGDLPLTFKWQRNSEDDLGTGATVRRLDEYSTNLVIDRIESAHSANYTCIVQNVAGTQSFTVPLTVNVPPRWTLEPSDINVVLGMNVMLDCQAVGYPEPLITWRKAVGDHPGEYKEFLYEPHLNFYRNGSIEFTQITKESEGHYLCEAKNGISNGISKVIYLKVNSPAYFPQKSKQIYVEKGEQAHLQCTALGDNPITISWKINNQILAEDFDPRYTIREQVLDERIVSELGVSHVFRQDTNVLTCHASNSYGQDEMTLHLIVQETPEAPKNIRVVDQQSRSLQISWTAPYPGNSPLLSYTINYKQISELWESQQAKVIIPGTQTIATVENLHPSKSYHFRILAENKLGMSEPSEVIQATTQEEAPEGPPLEVQAEPRSSTEIYVSWEPPSRESWNGNLLGYYVGYTETDETSPLSAPISQHSHVKTVEVGSQFGGQTIIDQLNMFTNYKISVQAFNSRGAGPYSDYVIVQTNEGVPTSPPEKVGCATVSSDVIDVWWEPPAIEGRNGIIQGYKVNYYPAEDWYENSDYVVQSSSGPKITLSRLLKYTNYSLAVLAYTSGGDGVPSSPIFCRTAEDVPGPPENIKASMSDVNKILISWTPPDQQTGVITGYTFYMGILELGKEGGTHKHVLSPNGLMFETQQVSQGNTYQFWVTASTKVGEGTSTPVLTVTPSNKVPAKIMSFSRSIITPWKKNISLPCYVVGKPGVRITWKFKDKPINISNKRYQVSKNGMLLVRDIQSSDQGNYSCYAENQFGNDLIKYKVLVRVPPDPPVLYVVKTETNSLQLKWTTQKNPDVPIKGFIIHYKRDHGDWEEIEVKSKTLVHILSNLWCGSRYQLYITAYNKIGTGLPCDIVNAHTKGSVPIKPNVEQFVTTNATAITLWLDAWNDGGCEIHYFIVEYRERTRSDWILASNHVQPGDRYYTIPQLKAATRYFIRITAHNNAGATVGVFNITTLDEDGTLVIPKIVSVPELASSSSVYSYAKSILMAVFITLTLFLLMAACVYIKTRKNDSCVMGESASVAQMQNEQNRDQQYAEQEEARVMSVDSATFKTDSSEYVEDICPYATFQLKSEGSITGNVYSGPYQSLRSSFVYHDLPSGSGDTYKGRHCSREPEYTKVRRKVGRLREPHSESQESDNLGSTDSEIKKILTLHLPISEYGSDSEEGAAQLTNQEMITFRHCIPRDVVNGEESSSSSDRSIAGLRKLTPHRKMKSEKLKTWKNSSRFGNGYPTHNEETSFTFNERIKPPIRFSDQCLLDNPDLEQGLRRTVSSRENLTPPYRLTRESAFQIDV